jgi:hypothetical protein
METNNQITKAKVLPPTSPGSVAAGKAAASRYANLKLEEPTSWKPWIIAALVLLLLVGTVVGYFLFRPDPLLAEVKDDFQKLTEDRNEKDPSKKLSREERREIGQRIRTNLENMTDEQRRALFAEGMKKWREREKEKMDRYFKMSPEEKTAFLDKEIEQQEARREQMQQWREEREKRKQEAAAKGETLKEDNGRRGWGGPGGGRGGFSKLSPDERQNRMKARLDNSTADERAQRWQFRQDMNARRQQLGLPTGGRGWGGWGGR